MSIPIIEDPAVKPETYYYINADTCRATTDGEAWERVLPPEYQGMVVVCSVGMREWVEQRLAKS